MKKKKEMSKIRRANKGIGGEVNREQNADVSGAAFSAEWNMRRREHKG